MGRIDFLKSFIFDHVQKQQHKNYKYECTMVAQLILTACQPVTGYFMPWGYIYIYIYIYIHFLCNFLRDSGTWLPTVEPLGIK